MNGPVRLAEPGDSEEIVDLFLDEYDRYFGKFSDPELMAEALEDMHHGVEEGDPWAGVFVLDVEGGTKGVSAVKQNRPGWSELSSTVIHPKYRGRKVNGEKAYQLLHEARKEFDESFYPDEKRYTQTVSFTGKSQKGSLNAGFVPVGYSDGQFFEANYGDGRISTVYMIDTENDFRDSGEAYIPEGEIREVSVQALENLQDAGVDIERSLEEDIERPDTVSVMEATAEAIGQARLTVVPEAEELKEWSYSEVLDWIDEKQESSEIDWTGLEVASETPLSAALIEDTGLDFERYQPDGLYLGDQWMDVVGLQDRPSGTRQRYFIDEAMDVIEGSGIPYEVVGSEEFSGTEVYSVEIL